MGGDGANADLPNALPDALPENALAGALNALAVLAPDPKTLPDDA